MLVIIGAASKPDNSFEWVSSYASYANTKFAVAAGGFAYAEGTKDSMTIKMIDSTASQLYTYTRQRTRYFDKDDESFILSFV